MFLAASLVHSLESVRKDRFVSITYLLQQADKSGEVFADIPFSLGGKGIYSCELKQKMATAHAIGLLSENRTPAGVWLVAGREIRIALSRANGHFSHSSLLLTSARKLNAQPDAALRAAATVHWQTRNLPLDRLPDIFAGASNQSLRGLTLLLNLGLISPMPPSSRTTRGR